MNKEQLTDFLGVLHFHGYIDHDVSKLGELADLANFTTPTPPKLSAEEIEEEREQALKRGSVDYANGYIEGLKDGINRNQPAPFTPERSPKEEAERLMQIYRDELFVKYDAKWHNERILNYTITALKLRGLDTTYEEQVLNELKQL